MNLYRRNNDEFIGKTTVWADNSLGLGMETFLIDEERESKKLLE